MKILGFHLNVEDFLVGAGRRHRKTERKKKVCSKIEKCHAFLEGIDKVPCKDEGWSTVENRDHNRERWAYYFFVSNLF